MSNATDNYEARLADWGFIPASTPTRPTSHTVALYSAVADAEAGTVTELSGDGYARVAITFSRTAGVVSNAADVEFPEATADWLEATHFGVYDHAGTLMIVKALTTPRTATNGTSPRFPAGTLTVSHQ